MGRMDRILPSLGTSYRMTGEEHMAHPRSGKWDSQYPILPLGGVRSGPNQHEIFDRLAQRETLWHEKHTGAGSARLKKAAEVPRHCLEIVRDQDAILRSRKREHLGIVDSFQVRFPAERNSSRVLAAGSPRRSPR